MDEMVGKPLGWGMSGQGPVCVLAAQVVWQGSVLDGEDTESSWLVHGIARGRAGRSAVSLG